MLANGLAMHHAYTRLGLTSCGNLDGPSCAVPLAIRAGIRRLGGPPAALPDVHSRAIGVFVGAPLSLANSNRARSASRGPRAAIASNGWSSTRPAWRCAHRPCPRVLRSVQLVVRAVRRDHRPDVQRQAYEVAGIVFAARTLFAFTLGALLGTLIRRTVPAMAATAARWGAAVWPSVTYLRPHIQKPITTIGHPAKGAITGSHVPFNANVINVWEQNASGHHISFGQIEQQAIAANGGTPPSLHQFQDWMTQHHYSEWVSYQPNNWFWHFQTIEATVYIIVAVVLAVATVLVLRRRAS